MADEPRKDVPDTTLEEIRDIISKMAIGADPPGSWRLNSAARHFISAAMRAAEGAATCDIKVALKEINLMGFNLSSAYRNTEEIELPFEQDQASNALNNLNLSYLDFISELVFSGCDCKDVDGSLIVAGNIEAKNEMLRRRAKRGEFFSFKDWKRLHGQR